MDDSRLGIKIRVSKYEFIYFSTKTYVVGAQKNRLNETVLSSTHNICLHRRIRKYSLFYSLFSQLHLKRHTLKN